MYIHMLLYIKPVPRLATMGHNFSTYMLLGKNIYIWGGSELDEQSFLFSKQIMLYQPVSKSI